MAFLFNPFESSLSRFGDFDEDVFWPFGTTQQRIGAGPSGSKALTSRQGQSQQTGVTRPRMDWLEQDGKYVLTFEMPGLKKDDCDISLHDNVLTVSGKTSSERESKSETGQYLVSERRWGTFSRSVAVPNGLKPEEIQASMDHGILKISMPKDAKESETKKITIG